MEVHARRNHRGVHLAKKVLTNKYKQRPNISLRTRIATFKLPRTRAPGYLAAYGHFPAIAKPIPMKLTTNTTVKKRLYALYQMTQRTHKGVLFFADLAGAGGGFATSGRATGTSFSRDCTANTSMSTAFFSSLVGSVSWGEWTSSVPFSAMRRENKPEVLDIRVESFYRPETDAGLLSMIFPR